MKVIQLLPELNAGGVERGTLEMSKFLVEQGHESVVISNGGNMVSQLEQEGGRHITMPVHRKSLSSFAQVRPLRELFHQESPDLIHLRSRVPAWISYLAWKKMPATQRPKLVSTVHGFYSVNAYSKVMTCGQRVICVSESVRNYVIDSYPTVDSSKLRVIHRGASPIDFPYGYLPSDGWLASWREEFPHLEDRKLVCLPGRITRWKGQLDFIEVISRLKSDCPSIHGIIVGSPHAKKQDFMDELKASIESKGLQNHVTLVSHRQDLREIMAISSVVVSCSTDPEAFGRVTLEALSLGRPVMGYAHGGVAEQLDALMPEGKLAVGDVDGMASKLKKWLNHAPFPASTNPFTKEAMVGKTLDVYRELMQD